MPISLEGGAIRSQRGARWFHATARSLHNVGECLIPKEKQAKTYGNEINLKIQLI